MFTATTFEGRYKKLMEQKKRGDVFFVAEKNIVSKRELCSKNNNKSIHNNRTTAIYVFGSFIIFCLQKQNQ